MLIELSPQPVMLLPASQAVLPVPDGRFAALVALEPEAEFTAVPVSVEGVPDEAGVPERAIKDDGAVVEDGFAPDPIPEPHVAMIAVPVQADPPARADSAQTPLPCKGHAAEPVVTAQVQQGPPPTKPETPGTVAAAPGIAPFVVPAVAPTMVPAVVPPSAPVVPDQPSPTDGAPPRADAPPVEGVEKAAPVPADNGPRPAAAMPVAQARPPALPPPGARAEAMPPTAREAVAPQTALASIVQTDSPAPVAEKAPGGDPAPAPVEAVERVVRAETMPETAPLTASTASAPEQRAAPPALPVVQQVAQQAVQGLSAGTLAPGEGRIGVTLSPAELGRVEMVLHETDTRLVLVIQAERPETMDLMRRHLALLQEELSRVGWSGLDLQLETGADRRGAETPERRARDTPTTTAPRFAAPDAAQPAADGRLDLRL